MIDEPKIDDYELEPYSPPPALGEQALKVWRSITSSPGRAVLTTVSGVAFVFGLVALIPTTAYTQDSVSRIRASCGIGYYFGSSPNASVRVACGQAYNSRATLLVVCAMTLLLAVSALIWSLWAESRRGLKGAPARIKRLLESPLGASASALAVVFLIVDVFSLRTVPLYLSDSSSSSYRLVHCGIQYYVFGGPSADVQSDCRSRYAGHAWVFLSATAILIVLLVLAARISREAGTRVASGSPPVAEMDLAGQLGSSEVTMEIPTHLAEPETTPQAILTREPTSRRRTQQAPKAAGEKAKTRSSKSGTTSKGARPLESKQRATSAAPVPASRRRRPAAET